MLHVKIWYQYIILQECILMSICFSTENLEVHHKRCDGRNDIEKTQVYVAFAMKILWSKQLERYLGAVAIEKQGIRHITNG